MEFILYFFDPNFMGIAHIYPMVSKGYIPPGMRFVRVHAFKK
jgi:hypothetical protein